MEFWRGEKVIDEFEKLETERCKQFKREVVRDRRLMERVFVLKR